MPFRSTVCNLFLARNFCYDLLIQMTPDERSSMKLFFCAFKLTVLYFFSLKPELAI